MVSRGRLGLPLFTGGHGSSMRVHRVTAHPCAPGAAPPTVFAAVDDYNFRHEAISTLWLTWRDPAAQALIAQQSAGQNVSGEHRSGQGAVCCPAGQHTGRPGSSQLAASRWRQNELLECCQQAFYCWVGCRFRRVPAAVHQ